MIHWQTPLALIFAFASVVEWVHFQDALAKGDPVKMAGTAIAAIACGFMAAEMFRGVWRIF
jgi:hypothetical protein